MKSFSVVALAALAQQAAAHATFQQLWVDGVDFGDQCARRVLSNSPITDVGSNQIRCNANAGRASGKCPVKAGGTVTVEMHQQNGDRSCNNEAIGGAHYGPVQVYLTKVSDASTADGSTGWFKIYSASWAKNPSGKVGDDDFWGVKDLNKCCGKMDVPIPRDIPAGDYLLRAEVIALHASGGVGGAQHYMTCYELTVSGGGSASPATVRFPGAYSARDPGILVNIHSALSTYIAPGPAVYAGGTTRQVGSGSCSGCEGTCKAGSGPTGVVVGAPATGGGGGGGGGAGPVACQVAKYGQCGGTGYTGCTTCESGSRCVDVSPPYYAQCA